MRRKDDGFTTIEMVIGVAVILLIGAFVLSILLDHIERSKVARAAKNVLSSNIAMRSFILKKDGELPVPTSGNYMEYLVSEGLLGTPPRLHGPQATSWEVVKISDDYFIRFSCDLEQEGNFLTKLDENIDGGSGAATGDMVWPSP